ncbi:MAG: ABC transporter ATP-binding protein [Sandaracinaceae bacterium]|nr:ABC transporter ATP-binding protein [Sandaracinaceae bacterium]
MSDTAPKKKTADLLRAFHEEQNVEAGADITLLRRLWPYVKGHLWLFVVAFGLMPVVTIASIQQPRLMGRAVSAAVQEHSESVLQSITWMYVIAIAVEFVARFAQVYLMQLAGQRSMGDLRRAVFAHVQGLRVGYFDRTPVGRVVTRVTNDVDALGELFASGAVMAIADVLTLVGIIVSMLMIDWRLSLIAFAALPPLALAVNGFRRYARDAFRSIRALTARLNAYLSEQVQGVAIVQAFGREEPCRNEYDSINANYRDANYNAIKYDALLYSVVESVAAACVALVLWYAGVRAGFIEGTAANAVYVGTVVAFYEYMQRFFVPIRDLSTKYTIVQQSLASAERIFSLLDTKEPDAPAGVTPSDLPPPPDAGVAIRFDHVSFAYRDGERVLSDVSFDVRRGERVAVVGATGAGKTTVTALLLRLYEMNAGAIFVDGKDVRAYGREELRNKFAVVPQDVFLFAGDVFSNIAVGDPRPSEERVRQALSRVGAMDCLAAREGGIFAKVAERGSNFSSGEKQLLAFARALYRDPEMLILDEATANIDSETEARLQVAVDEVLAGRTGIVIAHRLSTIRKADRILVFHKGEIVEQGTHTQLLQLDGVYARLHLLQFASAANSVESAAVI